MFWGNKDLRGTHNLTREAYRSTGKVAGAMTELYSCAIGALRSGLSWEGWSGQTGEVAPGISSIGREFWGRGVRGEGDKTACIGKSAQL